MADSDSIKLCECGCGRQTTVSKYTNHRRGFVKGKPNRFLPGHRASHHHHARHGARSKTYESWLAMWQRCTVKTASGYARYGGRGITICDRWQKFKNFLEDMGERPPDLTLDRLKNDLGYSKENCAWRDYMAQANNRRNNRLLTALGKTQTCAQWCREIPISRGVLDYRLRRGWAPEDALTKPRYFHGAARKAR